MQEGRIMAAYKHGVTLVKPEDVATGGVTSEMARKWKVLQDLQVTLRTAAAAAQAEHAFLAAEAQQLPCVSGLGC
jgi:hypothetical protein